MVRLSKYFHSVVGAITFIVCLSSCETDDVLYKRIYSEEEQSSLAETLHNGVGLYYQGSVGDRMMIYEGNSYSTENAWGTRELGVPYLKRGFAAEANKYYKLATEYEPEEWLGYKVYCWLYFYRDYETALREVDIYDAYTPGEVDYPQSTSVHYMRGLCLLHLGRYDEAIVELTLNIDKEVEMVGPDYINSLPYLALGISYQKDGQLMKADSVFSVGIRYNDASSELNYYKAVNYLDMNMTGQAKDYLSTAQKLFVQGSVNKRPYVEEFFAIYQEDLDRLSNDLVPDSAVLVK